MLTARWCGVCHAELDRLRLVHLLFGERVRLVTVDVEHNPLRGGLVDLLPEKAVTAVPTFIFLADGRLLGSMTGALSLSMLVTLVRAAYPGHFDSSEAEATLRRTAERVRLNDPDARAGAWLTLVELAGAGIPSEYALPALCVLVDPCGRRISRSGTLRRVERVLGAVRRSPPLRCRDLCPARTCVPAREGDRDRFDAGRLRRTPIRQSTFPAIR